MSKPIVRDYSSPWINAKNSMWESVIHLGKKQCYKKNATIIGNGMVIDHLYYLQSGKIRLSKIMSDGTEKIIWYLEKNTLFGETPFWDRKPMEGLFVAMEESVVYSFSRYCIEQEILLRHPNLMLNMIEGLASKARFLSIQASDLMPLKKRLCKMLLYMVEREADQSTTGRIVCKSNLSQMELAGLLGVHRVTLNHAMAKLKKEGIVEDIIRGRIIIADYSRLLTSAFDLY